MISRGAPEDQGLRVRDTAVITVLNLAVCYVATASAVVGGVSWLLTFTPWTQFMSSGYSVPFFFLTFPLFGWSAFVLTSVRRPERDRRPRGNLLQEFPRGWRVPFTVLFVAVCATSLAAVFALPGQPEYEPGLRRYAYNEHGVLIPTTHAAYLHAVAVQNRLFLGAAIVFTSAAVAITWQERNRRRDLVTPDRWLRPVRPRPKIPLPAAVLALAAATAVAGSIASVALIVDRVDAYNTGGIYLRIGHPVRALLAPDHYVVFVGCTETSPARGCRPVLCRQASSRGHPQSQHRSQFRSPQRGRSALRWRVVLHGADEGSREPRPLCGSWPACLRGSVAGRRGTRAHRLDHPRGPVPADLARRADPACRALGVAAWLRRRARSRRASQRRARRARQRIGVTMNTYLLDDLGYAAVTDIDEPAGSGCCCGQLWWPASAPPSTRYRRSSDTKTSISAALPRRACGHSFTRVHQYSRGVPGNLGSK
jgi:hypothetical protein